MASSAELSIGNSLSSVTSRSVDCEISKPFEKMYSSEDMVESEAMPQSHSIGSSSESEEEDNPKQEMLNTLQDSHVSEIFKAAHHFSQNDRVDLIAERKKNQDLLNFISAHGLSVNDVNGFTRNGIVSGMVNEHQVFVQSSVPNVGPSAPLRSANDSHLPLPIAPLAHSPFNSPCKDKVSAQNESGQASSFREEGAPCPPTSWSPPRCH